MGTKLNYGSMPVHDEGFYAPKSIFVKIWISDLDDHILAIKKHIDLCLDTYNQKQLNPQALQQPFSFISKTLELSENTQKHLKKAKSTQEVLDICNSYQELKNKLEEEKQELLTKLAEKKRQMEELFAMTTNPEGLRKALEMEK